MIGILQTKTLFQRLSIRVTRLSRQFMIAAYLVCYRRAHVRQDES